MSKTLIIFEFIDEIESFTSAYGLERIKDRDSYVLALQPEVQAYLKRKDVKYLNTIKFFDKSSHQDLLLKSNEIIQSFRGLLDIRDDLGVEEGYNNTFIYYLRAFVHYLLWLIEIIDKAVDQLGIEKLVCLYRSNGSQIGYSISNDERYVGIICKIFSENKNLAFEPFFDKKKVCYLMPVKNLQERLYRAIKVLIYSLSSTFFLYRSKDRKIILAPSTAYNIEKASEQFKTIWDNFLLLTISNNSSNDIKKVLLSNSFLSLHAFRGGLSRGKRNGFLKMLEPVTLKLMEHINSSKLLSYRDIDFRDLVSCKIKKGIMPFLIRLYGQSVHLNKFLGKYRPVLILSQMAREISYNLGELARIYNIPSVLISHGSHVPPSNQYEEIEWREHGMGLMNTHYQYVAVQSPWAMEYLKKIPAADSKPITTGPLMFTGIEKDEAKRISLRRKIIPEFADHTVVLHAGTPKPRRYLRFYVYETLDEYIENINSLIRAVERIENLHLIVRFRPTDYMTEEDFADLLVKSGCYSIHSRGSFADYLQIADLLVSYSSTTIEEALQNKIPVLQYDSQGKYCHIEGQLLDPAKSPEVNSCYYVDAEEKLPWALRWLYENHFTKKVPDSLWKRHVFADGEKVTLPSYFKSLFANDNRYN